MLKHIIFPVWLLLIQGFTYGSDHVRYEFSGFCQILDLRMFLLNDTIENKSSPWLQIGDSWGGLKIIDYDLPTDSIVVEKDRTRRTLKLRSSKIENDISTASIIRGVYEQYGSVLKYSSDTELKFGDEFSVKASRGNMYYDSRNSILSGDLEIRTPKYVFIAKGGKIRYEKNKLLVTSTSIELGVK